MVRITLIDGSTQEIARDKARQVLPLPKLLRSPVLKKGISAVFCHRGKLVPVFGPIDGARADDWLLLLDEGACLIRGLPVFPEDAQSAAPVLASATAGPAVAAVPPPAPEAEPTDEELDAELAEIEQMLKSA